MFSIGGVTGVKGEASSPPGDSCMCTKDADKESQEEEEEETSGCSRTVGHDTDEPRGVSMVNRTSLYQSGFKYLPDTYFFDPVKCRLH